MARERRHRARPRRRRGRFSGLYKLLSLLVVTIAVVVACVVFFRVNQITVTGNNRYTAEEIIEASGIEIGDNLIVLPKSRIAARIRVGLPYVKSISITQSPPETVVITVTEHEAAAAVSGGDGSWWYIATSGKLLERISDPGETLRLTGLTAQGPIQGEALSVSEGLQGRLEYALSLLKELEEREMLRDCTELDCSSAGVLLLSYLDFQLKLPTTGDFAYMLSQLEWTFENGGVSRDGSGTFDFTISGKIYYSYE